MGSDSTRHGLGVPTREPTDCRCIQVGGGARVGCRVHYTGVAWLSPFVAGRRRLLLNVPDSVKGGRCEAVSLRPWIPGHLQREQGQLSRRYKSMVRCAYR